jgi:hypothetical protein
MTTGVCSATATVGAQIIRTVCARVLSWTVARRSGGGTTRLAEPRGGGVAILEADPTGHRLHYVRHLVEAVGPDRCVVFMSNQAAGSDEFAAHTDVISASMQVLTTADTHRALLESGVAGARTAGAQRLVLPDGDRYLLPLLLLMARHPRLRLHIRLLLMRTTAIGGIERPRPAMIVKPVLVQLLRIFPQVQILFLTDALGVVARRRGFPGISAVEDPVSPPAEPLGEMPLWLPPVGTNTTTIGVFGVISPRKNLPLLVEAVTCLPDAILVVGGRLEPGVRDFVDTDNHVRELVADGRMIVIDRPLSAQELAAGLASVDVVAVLYNNDGPSGILAEACVRHTPVLVPTGGWLAHVVESTKIGVATPLTASGVVGGIQKLRSDYEVYVDAARRNAPRLNTTNFAAKLLGSEPGTRCDRPTTAGRKPPNAHTAIRQGDFDLNSVSAGEVPGADGFLRS